MARPRRIGFAGALYDVTSKGNDRQDIFFTDDDRRGLLKALREAGYGNLKRTRGPHGRLWGGVHYVHENPPPPHPDL